MCLHALVTLRFSVAVVVLSPTAELHGDSVQVASWARFTLLNNCCDCGDVPKKESALPVTLCNDIVVKLI